MAETEGKPITVRLRRGGWEVEITCSESQLKSAIESVLSSLGASGQVSIPRPEEAEIAQGNKTCRGLIVDLWRESWFSDGKTLAQVHDEIGRRGYHYDRTAVSHALRDLVLETVLTRQGNSRNYLYIQKRPPGTSSFETDRNIHPSFQEAAAVSIAEEMSDEEEEN
jgi:hypothetical protein